MSLCFDWLSYSHIFFKTLLFKVYGNSCKLTSWILLQIILNIQHEYNHFANICAVCMLLVLHLNIDDDLMFHVNHKLMSCYNIIMFIINHLAFLSVKSYFSWLQHILFFHKSLCITLVGLNMKFYIFYVTPKVYDFYYISYIYGVC